VTAPIQADEEMSKQTKGINTPTCDKNRNKNKNMLGPCSHSPGPHFPPARHPVDKSVLHHAAAIRRASRFDWTRSCGFL
jgi:hypothetical protein